MDIDEIRRYIVSRDVCVDITLLDHYPGWVRTIIFLPANHVQVRFAGYGGDDGGGYRYGATYGTLEEAVRVIEDYLQRPVMQWTNYTKTGDYPAKMFDEAAVIDGSIQILEDVMHNRIVLPDDSHFRMLSARLTKPVYKRWLAHLNEMKNAKNT
jgi:hypothetical protein